MSTLPDASLTTSAADFMHGRYQRLHDGSPLRLFAKRLRSCQSPWTGFGALLGA